MKKSLFIISMLAMLGSSNVAAQDNNAEKNPTEQLLVYSNPRINVTLGSIVYEPKSATDQIVSAVANALTSNDVSIEDKTLVGPTREAIASSLNNVLRLRHLAGAPTQEQLEKETCIEVSATITGCNYTNRLREKVMDKRVLVTAFVYLKNIKTGEVIGSKQISSETWASDWSTMTECYNNTVHNFKANLINQFNAWYPLRGHMLDKGFEKGKKQKLKEIFIDLGTNQRLGLGYDVHIYTVRKIAGKVARRNIGYGKVTEVLGEDITSVTLKRGADEIKAAFDRGDEIAVEVR